jgi:hypothetical protein
MVTVTVVERPPEVISRTYVPVAARVSLPNVNRPLAKLPEVVPPMVVWGPLRTVRVTFEVSRLAVLPWESRAVTWTEKVLPITTEEEDNTAFKLAAGWPDRTVWVNVFPLLEE